MVSGTAVADDDDAAALEEPAADDPEDDPEDNPEDEPPEEDVVPLPPDEDVVPLPSVHASSANAAPAAQNQPALCNLQPLDMDRVYQARALGPMRAQVGYARVGQAWERSRIGVPRRLLGSS
jgi:hypothetical protein